MEGQDSRILLGDVTDTMSKLNGEQLDLVIADPPYNIGKDFGTTMEGQDNRILLGDVTDTMSKLNGEQFDLVIADPPYNIGKDFGTTKDTMPLCDYVDWTMQWLSPAMERLSTDGMVYMYGFSEILAHIAVKFPIQQQRWLAWHYTNKTVPSSKFWQRSHETILCLWNDTKPELCVDQIREPYTKSVLKINGKKRAGTKSRFGKDSKETVYCVHPKGALPRDVLKSPALAGGAGRKERWFWCRDCQDAYLVCELEEHKDHNTFKHETQKPEALTRRLIESRITPGTGRILVPFVGSGTECAVAKKLSVPYVGIEINPEYAAFANARITKTEREEKDDVQH